MQRAGVCLRAQWTDQHDSFLIPATFIASCSFIATHRLKAETRPHAAASIVRTHVDRAPNPAGLPFCAQVRTLALSPDGVLLLSIDEDGRALLINRKWVALVVAVTAG